MKHNDDDFHLYSDFTEPVYQERSPAGPSVLLPITMICVVVLTYFLVEHSRPVLLSATSQIASTPTAQTSFVLDSIAPLDFEVREPFELEMAGVLPVYENPDILIANHTLPTLSALPPSIEARPSIEFIPNLNRIDPQPTSAPRQAIPVASVIPAAIAPNEPSPEIIANIGPGELPIDHHHQQTSSQPEGPFPISKEASAMQQISQLLFEEIKRNGGVDVRFRSGGGLRIDQDPSTSLLQLSHDFSQPAVPAANLAVDHQCSAIPLISHSHQNEQFTPWLTPYDLNLYILEINRGHSVNLWQRGHWITAIEGRESNGSQQYRIVYEKLPNSNHDFQWCYQIAQTREDFQRKLARRKQAGFELVQSQVFHDRHNQPRYQAVWNRVPSK